MKPTITLFFIFAVLSASAQKNSNAFAGFKTKLENEGFSIQTESKFYLHQGETESVYFGMYPGRRYKIFFMSDDPYVNDVDVWLYDFSHNSELLTKSTGGEAKMAVVNYSPGKESIQGLLKCKNVDSNNPAKESKCYVVVAYKE